MIFDMLSPLAGIARRLTVLPNAGVSSVTRWHPAVVGVEVVRGCIDITNLNNLGADCGHSKYYPGEYTVKGSRTLRKA